MTRPPPRLGWSVGTGGLLLVCGLGALYAAHPLYEVDLFWHLKLGEVIADTGRIPTTDMFSAVAPDAPYVQFNWLWDLLAFWLVDGWGLLALRSAQAVLMGGTLGALYLWCWRRSAEPGLAFMLAAFTLVMAEDRFQARPDALTASFVVALLPLWVGGLREPSGRRLFGLGALSALWASLHGGGSLLVPLTCGALALGAWVEPASPERAGARRAGTLALLASVLGLFTSPTLLAGVSDWAVAIGPQLVEGNEEWLPTYTMATHGGGLSRYLIAFAPTLLAVLYALEQRARLRAQSVPARRPWGEWFLCVGLLVLAQQAVRNAFLCMVPLVFMALRRAARGLSARERLVAVLLGAACCALSFEDAVLASYGGLAELRENLALDVHPEAQPLQLGQFVSEAGIAGGVFNDGRWGGYLIYRGWPALRVLVDSRHHLMPEVLPVFRASRDPLRRGALAEHAFERWGLELTAFANPTFAAGPPPRWVLLFKAGPEELYQRLDAPHAPANLARARAWLVRRGAGPPAASLPALEAALRARGGADWLRAPRQVQRMRAARQLAQAQSAVERARGEGQLALLYFHADRAADALVHLRRLAALDPAEPRPALYAALIHAQAGALDRARAELDRLSRLDVSRLSGLQRQRLAGLQAQLGGPTR